MSGFCFLSEAGLSFEVRDSVFVSFVFVDPPNFQSAFLTSRLEPSRKFEKVPGRITVSDEVEECES